MMFEPADYRTDKSKSFPLSLMLCGIFISVFTNCAKVGSPTGGPKDETAPEVTLSIPANKAINSKSEELEITFSEFIVLKNLNEELVISPPLKERPVTRIRNKTLVIDLNNELRDNTTYTLNFGTAIADNNEGNLLPDFEFVFSTGPVIDSLAVTGSALNAFNLKPEKEKITVMLYDNLSDSAPYRDLPLYIAKTSSEGKFAINNIRPGTFRLFALKDANNNLKFDIPDEMIAFGDTSIIISPLSVQKINFIKDSSLLKTKIKSPEKGGTPTADTSKTDSVKFADKELYAVNTDLFLFTEEDMRQSIIAKERVRRELLTFAFNRPLFDSVRMVPLNFTAARWYLQDLSPNRDSVRIWITDTSLIHRDTLSLALTYTTTDSARNYIARTDTVILRFRPKDSKGSPGRKSKEGSILQDSLFLQLSSNIRRQSVVDLNQSILIISPGPVSSHDINKFHLTRIEDSLQYVQKITLADDTSSLYNIRFSVDWTENSIYKLLIEPGAVKDIYSITNDTLEIDFRTQKSDYYGKIILSSDSSELPLVVQLMDEKENKVAEKYLTENGQVVFDYLAPKKYRFKAILDRNKNRKWDTGNYLGRLQPEKVIYYPGLIDVRSNWDIEISWNVVKTVTSNR
jgi:hypothetical protein